jgi:predicted nucleic acid-binding protein
VNAFADSSFVVSAFVADEFNPTVWRWWRKNPQAVVMVTPLVLFEAENAIRSLPLSGGCSSADAGAALNGIRRALLEGVFVCRNVTGKRLFPQATRLSQHHTVAMAFGAMDVLHVAAAMELCADTLLTFDKRQGEMATAEGLAVKPLKL